MNFWIYAIALLAIPAAIISWPLLAGTAKERISGLLVLLLMPMIGLVLYQSIGTPAAINLPTVVKQESSGNQGPHSPQQPDMYEMVAQLQQRMAEDPDNAEGWLILGRSLKAMQRYDEAKAALTNANRLLPGVPLIMVELAEAILFNSGKPEITAESRQLIESALSIDPQQQKALWLLGLAAAQEGEKEHAAELWNRLLTLLDPASAAAITVAQQVEMLQNGPPLQPAEKPAINGISIPVTVTIADELAEGLGSEVSNNAVLFVFIHPAGTKGMPLAVKRLDAMRFPRSIQISDADLLRPGGSLLDFDKLDISARISMAGVAIAASGDYQANQITLDTKSIDAIALHLDQRVP